MICKHCGAQNDDSSFFCLQCGSRLERDDSQAQSYDYGHSQQDQSRYDSNAQNTNGFEPDSQSQNGSYTYNYNQSHNEQQSRNNDQGANGFEPGAQNQNGSYTYNYNQNYNYEPVNTSVVKKGSIIAALVVGILTRSIVAIVLAIIALVRCNEFETAVRTGDYPLADQKRDSAVKLRKWAWAFCIIAIVISVIVGILTLLGVGAGIFSEFFFPLGDEFLDDFDSFDNFSEMMISFIR